MHPHPTYILNHYNIILYNLQSTLFYS
ncbi:hypothetical protein CNEO2_1070034 [Clostridium neonatale]|nr:hypothetical protein CNEO2_1070034 [Clostridium neonatale]CAI3578793.1 hypothetical protein CNEO3_160033 [Clostridium neonatale]